MEDAYPEVVDDEAGYLYHAWEVTSTGEAARHHRLARWPGQGPLPASDALSDLERWALARRCLQLGRVEDFREQTRHILTAPCEHPALNYIEIMLQAAAQLARAGDLPDARAMLQVPESMPGPWPQPPARAEAWLTLLAGQPDEASLLYERYLASAETTGDELIEIAEDFVRADALTQARNWLTRTRAHLEAHEDRLNLVDLELLLAELEARVRAMKPDAH
ncbi:hypothetical protein DL240_12310 [Lujinxingia litoralis]|uniref:Tetratricopeptide repeat protein n=2 Tax=Lujinxingia litoralis TaxID=2211119 RepID=A0A328C3M6_9DELT|nr:hypothetical protein DL240_12310 [Lujinxingia litoralis]